MKIWISDDSFNKKATLLVILVPGTIQPSGHRAFEAVEAAEVAEASKVKEAAEVLRPEK